MEQFDAIVILMKRTFQNGVPRNAVGLITISGKCRAIKPSDRFFKFDNVCLNYANKYACTSVFKFHTFLYLDRLVVNLIIISICKQLTDCGLRLYE